MSLFIITIFSCKKEYLGLQYKDLTQEKLAKIILWIDIQQKKFNDPSSRLTIANLKENLKNAKYSCEKLENKETIIIFTLREPLKPDNTSYQQFSIKNLVIIETEDHNFKQGNIVEIIIKDEYNLKLSSSIITKIYNNKQNDTLNGISQIRSLSGKLIEEREYKYGKLHSIKHLSKGNNVFNEKDDKIVKEMNNCITWWLVTTYHYRDGSAETTREYVGTTCGNALSDVIGNDSGGNSIEETVDYISTSQVSNDETASAAPKITYHHHATVHRINGQVSSVIIDPTTVEPSWANYIDKYGRNTIRILTIFDHNNNWWSLGASALIRWSCLVNGQWRYTDGSPNYSKTTNITYETVQ